MTTPPINDTFDEWICTATYSDASIVVEPHAPTWVVSRATTLAKSRAVMEV